MGRYVFLLLTLLSAFGVGATDVKWIDREIDFGTLREIAGEATRYARFINTGKEPVAVAELRPSCGCTAAFTDREIVQPGDTATIAVTYDPAGRPGRFEKTLRVYLDDSYSFSLPLKGTVVAAPETVSKQYPYSIGPLALTSSSAFIGEMKHDEARHAFVNVYNQTPDSVAISWEVPSKAISVDAAPKRLGPGDIGAISIYYNARMENLYGPHELSFDLIASDEHGKKLAEGPLRVSANVVPAVRSLSPEQLAEAPSLECSPRMLELETVTEPKTLKFNVSLDNKGKSDLKIFRIYSSYPGIEILKYPESVKGGKSGIMEVSYDSDKMPSGPFSSSIIILSNDPLNPVKEFHFSGMRQY